MSGNGRLECFWDYRDTVGSNEYEVPHYLAELLLQKGYIVHGVIRRSSTFNTSRLDHIYQEPFKKDTNKFRINWQKAVFIFDELERRKIDYDQILLLDSTCMIKWNCPNFFEMTDHKFTAIRDMDNLRWIYNSIQGYKDFFDGFECDVKKYVNSGFIIFMLK